MKIIGNGLNGFIGGNIFITYYGPQNPDGSVPTKTIGLVGDKDLVKLFEQKSDQKVQDEISEIINFTRTINDAPTLDNNGMLDPPNQTYTPDPEYDIV